MHILIGDEKVFPNDNDKDLIVIRPYKKDEKIRDDSFQHVEILGILIGGKSYQEAYSSTSFSNEMFRKLNCTDLNDDQKKVINEYFITLHDGIMKVLLPLLKKTSKITHLDLERYYFIQRNDIQIPPDTVYNSIYKVKMFNQFFYYITAILEKTKVIALFSKHRELYHRLHTIGEITKTMSILIPLSTEVEDLTKQMGNVNMNKSPSPTVQAVNAAAGAAAGAAASVYNGTASVYNEFLRLVQQPNKSKQDVATPQPTASQPAAPQTTAPQTTAHALVNQGRRRVEQDAENSDNDSVGTVGTAVEREFDEETLESGSDDASTDTNLVYQDLNPRKETQFVQKKKKLPENLEWLHTKLLKNSQILTLEFVEKGASIQKLHISVYYDDKFDRVYNYSESQSRIDYRFYFDNKNMLRKIVKLPVDVEK